MRLITALFESRRRPPPPEQAIPETRMDRLRQSYRRRLSDALEDVFHRACVENDFRTAACLYAVLEDMYRRRAKTHGAERRFSEEVLVRAREALEQCRDRVRNMNRPEPKLISSDAG